MNQINLLSPLKQKHVLNLYIFLFVKFIFILLLITTISIGIILGGASFLLNESVQQITLYSNSVDKEFNAVNKEILRVNTSLKQIDFATTLEKTWSRQILAILKQVNPPAVSLSGLAVSNEGSIITMQGKAQNRGAILDFQSHLKQVDFIEDASLPLENLIRENNIEFQITLQLKH